MNKVETKYYSWKKVGMILTIIFLIIFLIGVSLIIAIWIINSLDNTSKFEVPNAFALLLQSSSSSSKRANNTEYILAILLVVVTSLSLVGLIISSIFWSVGARHTKK